MAIDPVCGMEVDEKTSPWKSDYEGRTYFFCGRMCKEDFDDNPKKFLKVA